MKRSIFIQRTSRPTDFRAHTYVMTANSAFREFYERSAFLDSTIMREWTKRSFHLDNDTILIEKQDIDREEHEHHRDRKETTSLEMEDVGEIRRRDSEHQPCRFTPQRSTDSDIGRYDMFPIVNHTISTNQQIFKDDVL